MSRYYKVVISDPSSGNVIVPSGFEGLLGGASYTSFVNGQTLPGAWDVEMDVPVIGAATPQGSALLRIWGVSRQEISQAKDLNGKNVSVYGGMQKGLPLANPAQAGLLVQGYVFQAFGNWIGTDQTLDLVINAGQATGSAKGGTGTLAQPKNLVLNWKAGTSLSDALKTTLATAFPGMTVSVNISSKIVRQNDELGFFPTLEQLAQYALRTSKDVIKTDGYAGVTIVPAKNAITVLDNSQQQGGQAKAIAFQDLIGQPTWIESPNIQFKTVMRGDINVGDQITLPQTVTTTSSAAASSLVNLGLTFQGGFTVVSERHVGRYRAPMADAWVSVFEGAPNKVVAA